jgi:hypothetical protein
MTEAQKLAARMKIFADLGLDPVTGMCRTTTFPTLSKVQAANDAASREILTEHELAVRAAHEISPSTFLAAKGPVLASTEPASNYDPTEDIRECLAKYSAGVGPNPRNHLFLAAALINRALKR